MSESIFEHTTSITGLTCKPLSILSETISTQEMSMARGGNGGSRPHDVDTSLDPGRVYNELLKEYGGNSCPDGCPLPCCEKDPNPGGMGGGDLTGTTGRGGGEGGPDDRLTVYTPPADSSASADSSGTQDQNGGDLDNGEDDGQEDDKSVTDHIVDFFRDIYDDFDDVFNVDNHHPDENGDDSGMEDGEDDDDEDNGGDGDN